MLSAEESQVAASSESADYEPEVAPPRQRRSRRATSGRRSVAGELRLREASAPLDARQLYMSQIQDIPVLDREAVAELSNRIREQQALFERALLGIPGAALRVVEEWQSRRSRGLVTAVLCRNARDGSRRDWGKHIDTHLARAQQQLARTAVSYTRVGETLRKAEISFELLTEIHTGLVAATAPGTDRAARRRLGLDTAAARHRLEQAGRALAAYYE